MKYPPGIQKLRKTLEDQWENCRWGLKRCDESPEDCQATLRWMNKEPDCIWTKLWSAILLGEDQEGREFVLQTEQFPHGNGHWRQMASSSPFGLLRMGRLN